MKQLFSHSACLLALSFSMAERSIGADVILNEYNAVGNGVFLENEGEDADALDEA